MHDAENQLHGREPGIGGAANAERHPGKVEQCEAAWAKWQDAARNFRGIGDRLEARKLLSGITRNRHGYQIRFIRGRKVIFSRYVNGFSQESFLEAVRLRDEGLRELRRAGLKEEPYRKRLNPIPPEVLRALGLSSPVIGIYRLASRSSYRVRYTTPAGRRRFRNFYYRRVPEAVAYAAAIAFLQQRLGQEESRETAVSF